MNKHRVVITGASGLLGRQLMKESQKLYDTIGIVNKRYNNETHLVKCDLLKPEMEKVLMDLRPDFIVHAAAERFPDKVENDFYSTKLLNVGVSGRLSKLADEIGAKFIYISTDYVFDGLNPPYSHTDLPCPINKYGLTKYEGEVAVLAANLDSCVLRVPILYGPVEYIEESAVTTLLQVLRGPQKKFISHYERRYPSHTQDIAIIVTSLIKLILKDDSIRGVFQWSGDEQLTKYDMVVSIADVFDLPYSHIEPDPIPQTSSTLRPYDARMDSTRLKDLGISHHTQFKVGIKDCLEPWVKGLMNDEIRIKL